MAEQTPSAPAKPEPLKKGAAVAVQCKGFTYEGVLDADDDGSGNVTVVNLGSVERTRVTAR